VGRGNEAGRKTERRMPAKTERRMVGGDEKIRI